MNKKRSQWFGNISVMTNNPLRQEIMNFSPCLKKEADRIAVAHRIVRGFPLAEGMRQPVEKRKNRLRIIDQYEKTRHPESLSDESL